MKWFVKKCSVKAEDLMNFYGVRKPLAYALYNRKIRNRDEIKRYIDTDNFCFENIENLSGVKEAFSIIKEVINKKKKIFIYGDYDADGVMSTSIMYKGLYGLEADVNYFIPNRVEDGYGLNDKAVEKLIGEGAELIITCDNGISAVRQIQLAKNKGVKVIILDHHEPPFEELNGVKNEILPDADAVVNAKIENCGYKFTQMCAGGLCYRFICGLYKFLGRKLEFCDELCELAAVATICDVVNLVDENRAIAAKGLKFINSGSRNLGLKTLIELKEIKSVNSYSIGFVIGPCINASGRLDSAKIAVELFVTNDIKRAMELAKQLNKFNEERKSITVDCLDRITNNIENSDLKEDKIIVVYDKETHESVAGIIAGRIKERYCRPAIVLTNAEEGVKGSGRSVEAYNMFKGLLRVKDIMIKFGGHTMAAGMSLEEHNIEIFRQRLNNECALTFEEMSPVLRVETILDIEDISVESAKELNILAPFGKANEKPLFGIKNVIAENIRFVGSEGNIVSFNIEKNGKRVKAVDFDNYDLWINWLNNNGYNEVNYRLARINIDTVFTLDVNEYNGYTNPQIVIKNIRMTNKR